jgi:bla regulator protein BlaR1
MIAAATNHLWQSTLFVLAATLVAAALRRNGAHVRHAVWVAASLKFLVPFAGLITLGGALPGLVPSATAIIAPAAVAAPDLSVVVERLARPFAIEALAAAPALPNRSGADWERVAVAVWACGFFAVALMRWRGWRRVQTIRRASKPCALEAPVPVRTSSGLLEPGVVGLFRPVLLLPAGFDDLLTPAQRRAVLEHEFCHVRRRDNVTSAVHMLVEALFWFHPLVWWVGTRLVDERERACDEHVLTVCAEPQAYAEGILTVCRRYVESPLPCVSGVTGSDLKRRLTSILDGRVGLRLSAARKAALAMAALLALVLPLGAGLVAAPAGTSLVAERSRITIASGQALSPPLAAASIEPCAGPRPVPAGAPSASGRGGPGGAGVAPWAAQVSPGHVYWACVTLGELVDQAYADLDHPLVNAAGQGPADARRPARVRGGPSWAAHDRFTIDATVPPDVTAQALEGRSGRNLVALPPAMSAALRALLEDRFRVTVRRDSEPREIYVLRVGANGLDGTRIRRTTDGDCVSIDEYRAAVDVNPGLRTSLRICGRYFVSATDQQYTDFTLSRLAAALSQTMELAVLDRTDVAGAFTFTIRTPAPGEGEAPDSRLLRGIEELGFDVDRTIGTAEFLVLERADRPR